MKALKPKECFRFTSIICSSIGAIPMTFDSSPLEMPTVTPPEVDTIAVARPVIIIAPNNDISAARPPHLGEVHYIYTQAPEFI